MVVSVRLGLDLRCATLSFATPRRFRTNDASMNTAALPLPHGTIIHLDLNGDQITLRTRSDMKALCIAVLNPWGETVVYVWADHAAGSPWLLMMATTPSSG